MKLLDKAREKLNPSKATREAAMDGLITTLKLLETLFDGIPAVRDPPKAVVSAAIQLLEQVEVRLIYPSLRIRLHSLWNTRLPKATRRYSNVSTRTLSP